MKNTKFIFLLACFLITVVPLSSRRVRGQSFTRRKIVSPSLESKQTELATTKNAEVEPAQSRSGVYGGKTKTGDSDPRLLATPSPPAKKKRPVQKGTKTKLAGHQKKGDAIKSTHGRKSGKKIKSDREIESDSAILSPDGPAAVVEQPAPIEPSGPSPGPGPSPEPTPNPTSAPVLPPSPPKRTIPAPPYVEPSSAPIRVAGGGLDFKFQNKLLESSKAASRWMYRDRLLISGLIVGVLALFK